MNSNEKQWLIDTIADFIIAYKAIHEHDQFRIKLFTNPSSPKIPVYITAMNDDVIFFSVLNIYQEVISEIQDINYDGFGEIQLGHEISEYGLRKAPKYLLNNELSEEIEQVLIA